MPSAIGVPVAPRALATVLIVTTTIVAAFATFVAGGSSSFEILRDRLVYDAIAAIALTPWLAVATFRPTLRPASKLMPAIVICLAVYGISTASSRNVRLSLEMLGYAVLLAGLYLLLVALMRRPILRAHFERLALVLGASVCLVYLVQVGQQWITWWQLLGHFAIPPLRPSFAGFIYPNPLATIAIILGVFGLATMPISGRPGTVTAIGLTLLVLATTFITGSRGAWVGFAAGVAVTGVAALSVERALRAQVRSALRSPRIASAALACTLFSVAALAVAAHGGRLTIGDNGARASFWAVSLRMLQAAPLTGVGPGVWPTLRATFTLPTEADYYIPHAHDIFIQALAEFGLLAIPAAIAVVATFGRLVKAAIRELDAKGRRVAYATLFSVVLLAGQQLVDVLVNVPAVLCAIALPLAWLDSTALGQPGAEATSPCPPHGDPWRRWATLGAMGAVVITLVGLGAIERVSAISLLVGVEAADGGDWLAAKTAFAQAAREDPSLTAYGFELGLTAANAGDLATAKAALSASAATDDYTYAWLDLAGVRWKLGDRVGARSALSRAERLGSQRADVALAAGWLREQLGDVTLATQDYGAALAHMPTLAIDPFWSDGRRRAIWTAIVDVAAKTNLDARVIAGPTSTSLAGAARLPPAQRSFYDVVIRAWTRDSAAQAELNRLAAAGSDPSAQAWSAVIAARDGDDAAVSRYLAILQIDDVEATGGVVPQPMTIVFDPSAPGVVSDLERYGSVYRRLLPSANVIGILPTLQPYQARP